MASTYSAPAPDTRERYERDGFASPIDVFDEREIGAIRAGFDALEASLGADEVRTGLQSRHLDTRFIWDMATDPRVLDWVESIMGPDIVLLSSQFFVKYPVAGVEHFVGWHQDVTYWGLEPAMAHSAWIAVDDSKLENGCMEVIPGTHREGIAPHAKSSIPGNILSIEQEIPGEYVDRSRAVPMELTAGQMSLHHGKLYHASAPNRSGRRRCGLAVRYITPDVRQVKDNSRGRRWAPVLLRGEDPSGFYTAAELPFPLPAAA